MKAWKKLLILVIVAIVLALVSAKAFGEEDEAKSEFVPPHLPWAFHDITRRSQLITHNQIVFEIWGGLEVMTDVNPLFGVNPFATPFAPIVVQNPTPFNPFFPTIPTVPPPDNFPFVAPGGQAEPVDGVVKTVGLFGMKFEILPFECPWKDGKMLWQIGARYWMEGRHEEFPFNRSVWTFQLEGRILSTPTFADRFAIQARYLMGFGKRDWITDGDTLFANTLEFEGSARISKASRNALFLKGKSNFFYESDGAVAELSFEGHLGWRGIGEVEELADETRLYALFRAASRRDFEKEADLEEKSLCVGVGGEARIGPFVVGAQLGYYIYDKFKLKPLRVPTSFASTPFTPPNFFASGVLSPIFTEIDTPGIVFLVRAGVEF